MTKLSRRDLLVNAALGGMALVLPAGLSAQSNPVASTPLRNNIHLISGAGSNIVAAVGDESVVLVDGGLQHNATAVLAEVERLAEGRPVRALFNTNWRPEHCGLNHALGPEGTPIIAHENTRLWQNNDFYVAWEDRHYTPMPVNTQANQTFYESGELVLDDETLAYGHIGQCRSDGDIYVRLIESNILVAGGMMTVGTYPVLDYVTGGWINGARDGTEGLLAMADADTLIVPASGPVQRRPALENQQQMLDHAYDQVAGAFRTGRSLDQFMATAPMADFDAVYGDSTLFVALLYRGTWYHVPERAVPGII